MRLYEFADPTQYLLPETYAANLLKKNKNTKTDDTPDEVMGRLRKNPSTKRHSKTL